MPSCTSTSERKAWYFLISISSLSVIGAIIAIVGSIFLITSTSPFSIKNKFPSIIEGKIEVIKRHSNDSTGIIFLGDSSLLSGVVPGIFDDVSEVKSINLGIYGDAGYRAMFSLLEEYLDRGGKVDRIILMLSPQSLRIQSPQSFSKVYFALRRFSFSEWYRYLSFSSIIETSSIIIRDLVFEVDCKPRCVHENQIMVKERGFLGESRSVHPETQRFNTFNLEDGDIAQFIAFKRQIAERVDVNIPMDTIFVLSDNDDGIELWADALEPLKHRLLILDSNMFIDAAHFNNDGAKAVSTLLRNLKYQ